MFWGLSPSLDLQEEYLVEDVEELDEINILLIGGCDARHVIKTLAQSYRHKKRKINFHIIERCAELVARQILLLSIALENPERLGLLEKTRLFMEIYGNTLLRFTTSKYMISTSKNMVKMITDLNYMEKILPIISCEKIKYRERDYIEMLLKFWGAGNTNQLDICTLWDRRIRNSLGTRYDSRLGVFDWDYHMRFRELGGATVNVQEFKHFRLTGVAFTWLETEVSRPNYSLAAGVITSGEQFTHRGYLGDIVTGPYVTYGLDCQDKDMLKSSNGTYYKRATDISERNLLRMFYEIQTGQPLDSKQFDNDVEHNLGLVTIAKLDAKLSEACDYGDAKDRDDFDNFINLDYAKIFFHSYSALNIYPDKSDYQNKFHVMFVSNNLLKNLQPSIMQLMKNNGLVIIEGMKYVLNMKKDDIKAFGMELENMSETFKCTFVKTFEPLEDSFAKLRVKLE